MRRYLVIWLTLQLFLPLVAAAQSIPQELERWSDFVKARHPEWQCAKDAGNALQCVLPGKVSFDLQPNGAKFTLRATLYDRGLVPIPGSVELPPKAVLISQLDKKPITAELRIENGRVFAVLPAGSYELAGELSWGSAPSEIPVDPSIGLVEVAAKPNTSVVRSNSGFRLEERLGDTERDSLQTRVFRKIIDSSPLVVEQIFRFRVAGSARQINLGKVVPENSTPIEVQSPLPFQLTKDGELSLDLTPGEHEVWIKAVIPQPVLTVAAPKGNDPSWPEEEYWVFLPHTELRSVEVIGGEPVSGSVVNLPQAFQSESVYAVKGSKLELRPISRGEEQSAPDSLAFERELWLDLDGRAFSIRDRIGGQAPSSMRIDAQPELEVGRVKQQGEPALVTLRDGNPGIELRQADVSLEAISRMKNVGSFTATGWQADSTNGVSLRLHLPPSWELFTVVGAESMMGYRSWVESWSLLGIFLLSLLVISAYRLFGLAIGGLLALSILLNHTQHLEPKMLFVHLFILFAIKKYFTEIPEPWKPALNGMIALTFAALVLEELTFAKLQFTQFLFPNLPAGSRDSTVLQEIFLANELNLFCWPVILIFFGFALTLIRWALKTAAVWRILARLFGVGVVLSVAAGLLWGFLVTQGDHSAENRLNGIATSMEDSVPESSVGLTQSGDFNEPLRSLGRVSATPTLRSKPLSLGGTNVVAGPAIPVWSFKTINLSASGYVDKNSKITLKLIPPSITRLVCGLRTLLSLIICIFLFRFLFRAFGWGSSVKPLNILSALVVLFVPNFAHAELPSSELLNELEQRLQQEQCQAGPCAQIKELAVIAGASELRFSMKVSSRGRSTIALPGPLDSFQPRSVKKNERETTELRRNTDGYLEVVADPGENTIEATGPLPTAEPFSIQFHSRPIFTQAVADAFQIEGLSKDGTVEHGLRFVRKEGKSTARLTDSVVLPNWVVLTRRLSISSQITATTTVSRIGQLTNSYSVKIPLLNGEQVTSSAGIISEKAIEFQFPAQVESLSYESILPFSSPLKLIAEESLRVSEVWQVACASFLSCSNSGILPSSTLSGNLKQTTWNPFPGESAEIAIEQLKTIPGEFLSIDSVRNNVGYSESRLQGQLTLSARATQQGTLKLAAPENVQLLRILLDGRSMSFNDKNISLLLPPGAHSVEVDYEAARTSTLRQEAPRFTVTPPPHNITTVMSPARERWLIWTHGDGWGPSVLYWAKLVFIVLLCVLLARVELIPVHLGGALFLGIGLTSLPLVALVIPLLWLSLLTAPELALEKVTFGIRWLKVAVLSVLGIISIGELYEVVRLGLMLTPPMLVVGNGSTATELKWFVDHAPSLLPQASFIALPMWAWRALSLAWSLWLVGSVISWISKTVDRCKRKEAVEHVNG